MKTFKTVGRSMFATGRRGNCTIINKARQSQGVATEIPKHGNEKFKILVFVGNVAKVNSVNVVLGKDLKY